LTWSTEILGKVEGECIRWLTGSTDIVGRDNKRIVIVIVTEVMWESDGIKMHDCSDLHEAS